MRRNRCGRRWPERTDTPLDFQQMDRRIDHPAQRIEESP
jgi:hypothetical protein